MNKILLTSREDFFQVDSPFGKITLFITREGKIDKKSLIPFASLDKDIELNDLHPILLENNHLDKCRYYNYLLMEYINSCFV